jgi:O-acetyl-ADP-ribose deacetylase (regulator of RNase III)
MGLPIEIEIWRGEIAELEVDAIVVPANESLFMTTPIAAAVKRLAGEEVERAAVSQGPVAPGGAVVTGGGRLVTPYVIHAVAVSHDLQPDLERLRGAVRAALGAVAHLSLRRIAMAPLGTERGVFPPADAAAILLDELLIHADHAPGAPESVVIAVSRPEELVEFVSALDAIRSRTASAPPVEGR